MCLNVCKQTENWKDVSEDDHGDFSDDICNKAIKMNPDFTTNLWDVPNKVVINYLL